MIHSVPYQKRSKSRNKLACTQTGTVGRCSVYNGFASNVIYFTEMNTNTFFDDPASTYGYYTFLPDALEDLEDDDDLVIIPPDADQLTDEEQIEEDETTTTQLPHDVAGKIEIMKKNVPQDDWDTSDEEPLDHKQKRLKVSKRSKSEKKKKPTVSCDWDKREPLYRNWPSGSDLPEYTAEKEVLVENIRGLNPVDIFEKFCDQSTISYIVEQTLLYATQHNRHDFSVNGDDIRTFMAILFLSGYHRLPQERMYWSGDEDLGVQIVSAAMPRNKYDTIKQNIHFADNSNIDKTDKMFKLRPLMNILNEKFKQWGIFHTHLSVDEAMVRYFGHHSAKQFIRGKPTRFGYKNWVLASSDGFCYHFDTYCGKSNMENATDSLGGNVVLNLLEHVTNAKEHIVFFDNYFSTIQLMSTLVEKKFRATATVRENRISKCPLETSKILAKQQRGTFSYQFDKNNDLLVVRWVDNSVVSMITNFDTIEPMQKVKRWSKKDHRHVEVPQPHVYKTYNKRMGGVDLTDQSVNTYRIAIRGKKWWWVLFTYMLDLAMTNAWKLYLTSGQKMTQLEFTRCIVRHYLLKANSNSRRRKPTIPESVRLDSVGHFPQKLEKPLRCVVCHSRIRWACKKCKNTLCIERNCFELYHTQ